MSKKEYKLDQRHQKEYAFMRWVHHNMKPKSTEERQKELAREREEYLKTRTPWSAFRNFVSYYKLYIIIAVVALIAAITFTLQITGEEMKIGVITGSDFSLGPYNKTLCDYTDDMDNSGYVNIGMYHVQLQKDNWDKTLETAFSDPEVYLYLVDERGYQEVVMKHENEFENLHELYPADQFVENRRILLKGSDFCKYLDLDQDQIPDGLSLVVKKKAGSGKGSMYYDQAQLIVKRISWKWGLSTVRGKKLF